MMLDKKIKIEQPIFTFCYTDYEIKKVDGIHYYFTVIGKEEDSINICLVVCDTNQSIEKPTITEEKIPVFINQETKEEYIRIFDVTVNASQCREDL